MRTRAKERGHGNGGLEDTSEDTAGAMAANAIISSLSGFEPRNDKDSLGSTPAATGKVENGPLPQPLELTHSDATLKRNTKKTNDNGAAVETDSNVDTFSSDQDHRIFTTFEFEGTSPDLANSEEVSEKQHIAASLSDFGGSAALERTSSADLENGEEVSEHQDIAEDLSRSSDNFGGFSSFEHVSEPATKSPIQEDFFGGFSSYEESEESPACQHSDTNKMNVVVSVLENNVCATSLDNILESSESEHGLVDDSAVVPRGSDLAKLASFEEEIPPVGESHKEKSFQEEAVSELLGSATIEEEGKEAPTANQFSTAERDDENDDDFGDFGVFSGALDAASSPNMPSLEVETGAIESSRTTTIIAADCEFVTPDKTCARGSGQTMPISAEEKVNASQPSADASSVDLEKKSLDSAPEECVPASKPLAVTCSIGSENSEFGNLSNVKAFEEAPEWQIFPDCARAVVDQKTLTNDQEEVLASQPSAVVSSIEDTNVEFGEFGEPREEGIRSKDRNSHLSTPPESASRQGLFILNDNVRVMFNNVFVSDTPITLELSRIGMCSELPFDVTMRQTLVSVQNIRLFSYIVLTIAYISSHCMTVFFSSLQPLRRKTQVTHMRVSKNSPS